jgi:proton glutamate symport protein
MSHAIESTARQSRPPRIAAHWQVLIAMLFAVVLAAVLPADASIGGVRVVAACNFIGALFVNALKMLVVPLVASSLVVGVGQFAGQGGIGRLFGKLFACIGATSLVAALIGLGLVNLVEPGQVASAIPPIATTSARAAPAAADAAQLLLSIIPANILQAMSADQLLAVVFFALLFGFCAARLPQTEHQAVMNGARAIFAVMLHMARLVLKFAPLAVLCLLLGTLITNGVGALRQLGLYMMTVLAGLLLHAAVVMPLFLAIVVRVSPWRFFRAVLEALLTAFSTASSKASLPASFDALESRVGISSRVVRFALPLSATMNMNGTALYECVAAIFIAQFFGIELGLSAQLSIVAIALLTTLGNSGVPGGGVIGLTVVLGVAGLPAEGLAMVLAVDRVLDMARTAVNVWGDNCTTAFIASTEGEHLFATSAEMPR